MNRHKCYLSIFLFFISTFPTYAQNENAKIIIIFDSIPVLARSSSPFPNVTLFGNGPQITVFDHFHKTAYNPRSLIKDTLALDPEGGYIILSFMYSILHLPLDFVIPRGDTIRFCFKD